MEKPIFFEKLKTFLSSERGLLVLFGVIAFIMGVYKFSQTTRGEPPLVEESIESADTFIPQGQVLVPIELSNGESLSSLIHQYAIVDLFQTNAHGTSLKKQVGKRLKLIRAPQNPNKFAVLAPEHQAHELMQGETPLFAVIQNSKQDSSPSVIRGEHKSTPIKFFEKEKVNN